ncbi:hypothetical protein PS2_015481 [Malus domestica]
MASSSMATLSRTLSRSMQANSRTLLSMRFYTTTTTITGTSSSSSDSSDSDESNPLNSEAESAPGDASQPPPPSDEPVRRSFIYDRPLENGLDAGIYKAILVGQVGQSPLQKRLKSGASVTMFSIGTGGIRNNRRPLDNEDPVEYANRCNVQWHRVCVYPDRLSMIAMKNVVPGSIIYLEGNLETKIFTDPVSGLVRRVREISIRRNGRLVFLGKGDGAEQSPKWGLKEMLPSPKFLQASRTSTQCLHLPTPSPPPPPPIPQLQGVSTSSSFPSIKQCCKLSRRELAIRSNSLLLLLLGSQSVEGLLPSKARAENLEDTNNNEQAAETSNPSASATCIDRSPTKRAFLDISIDGEPVGRIIIGLHEDDAPVGAARFGSLVSGAAGTSYRRKEFVKIMPSYVQHGGVRSFGVDAELAKKTGSNLEVDSLNEEWERLNEKCPGIKNKAGTVSIIVRDPLKPPPKIKLVARKGKLEIDQEEVGTGPNGTEFVITTKDSPELDASALVVGTVLEGKEVVERLGQVKTVQENTSSPYFRVAKLIGDKRAVVAERGFNRPYAKVIVTNCGLIM